jgi:hypothetical protein
MLVSRSNRNTIAIIELRGEPQKHREIRGVSTVTFGSKNEGTPSKVPPRERFLAAIQLSLDLYALKGQKPDADSLKRSFVCLKRTDL